ncbi:MAG TPA: PEGA domain-containing protein [Kofleriaceae bacterium]|nr:PEGA domain-containing protein [Kofleriaceae bacterium]
MVVAALAVLTGGAPAVRGQAPAPAGPLRIAVLGFDPLGMDADKVARLEALFRMELERLAGGPSPSRREIARGLRGTRLAQCAGEDPCLAAIGKRLGVELVVSGNVAALGDSYVVNIKVVNAATGAELRRIASDPLRGNPDELIDSVRVAAYRLLAPERLLGAISVLADISGARVVLDGRVVGRTPLARPIAGLSLGAHRLEVRAPGYSAFADRVQVRFQKTTRVVVRLVVDPIAARAELARRASRRPRPAPRHWYDSGWFLIGAGVAAVVVGGAVGYSLARDDVLDCRAMPEACR